MNNQHICAHLTPVLVAQMVKNPPLVQETQVWSLGQEDPQEKEKATLLPGKPHGQRCMASYSPRGHKELDTTEWIKKQRHYFANKDPSCQGYGFSSSHV